MQMKNCSLRTFSNCGLQNFRARTNNFKNDGKKYYSIICRLTYRTTLFIRNLLCIFGFSPFLGINKNQERPRILILGTGWGFMNLALDLDVYSNDVQVISPNESFFFTPLLTQIISNRVPKEVCEIPLHELTFRGKREMIKYIKGKAIDIDKENKVVIYLDQENNKEERISYDYLIINVGNDNSDLVPGVKENALYMRNVQDSLKIRDTVLMNIMEVNEKWHCLSDDDKKKKLSFVIAGGGPTGVEVSGAIAELVQCFIYKKEYERLSEFISIKILEMGSKLLPITGDKIPEYAEFILSSKAKIQVILETRLLSVDENKLLIRKNDGTNEEIPYAVFIWAAGASPNALTKQICEKFADQSDFKEAITVNERLQVYGIPNTYAIGDCAIVKPNKLSDKYKEIHELASKSSGPTIEYLRNNFSVKQFPQMLNLSKIKELPQKDAIIDEKDLKNLLENLDFMYHSPPPTAQTANQQGKYLADILNNYPSNKEKQDCPVFLYNWKGSSCYIFNNYVAFHTPFGSMMGGLSTLFFWRVLYTSLLPTWKARFLLIRTWFSQLLGFPKV